MPSAIRMPTLFKLYTRERKLLFATKNCNMQSMLSKEWWPDVNHIIVQHFDSLDDLEDALIVARDKALTGDNKNDLLLT